MTEPTSFEDRVLGKGLAEPFAISAAWIRVWSPVRRWILSRQSERERLLTDIASLAVAAENYRQPGWPAAEFDALVERARLFARRGDVDSGYEVLHAAERHCIAGMPDGELRVKAAALRYEVAKKLKGTWRGSASVEALDRTMECRAEQLLDLRAAVADAVHHRNTHERNLHRKTDRLRVQVLIIGAFLLLQVVAIAWGVYVGCIQLIPAKAGATPPVEARLLLECIALGLFGGTLSTALSLNRVHHSLAYQEMESAWIISLARAFIGCAASIPVYIIASSKLITLGGPGLETQGILVLCFLAGFSERWFLHIIPAVPRTNPSQTAGTGQNPTTDNGTSTTRADKSG